MDFIFISNIISYLAMNLISALISALMLFLFLKAFSSKISDKNIIIYAETIAVIIFLLVSISNYPNLIIAINKDRIKIKYYNDKTIQQFLEYSDKKIDKLLTGEREE